MYTYLIVNILSLLFPLSYSFESKISYYKKWKYLFVAIVIVGCFFVIWDSIFTGLGIWRFNPKYILGIYFFRLPLEEWLFFIIIPFSSVFIYESLNYYIKKDILKPYSVVITFFLIGILLALGFLNLHRLYTSVTFFLTSVCLLVHYLVFKNEILGRFYLAYLVHLIPFFIVNGILTSYPVVIYNDAQNLGIRMGTIPIEDSIYGMFLLLFNISIYEYLAKRWSVNKSKI